MSSFDNLLRSLVDIPPVLAQCRLELLKFDCSLEELPELICAFSAKHSDYDKLAGRVLSHAIHLNMKGMTFSERMQRIHSLPDKHGNTTRRLSDGFLEFLSTHKKALDSAVDYGRNYDYGYVAVRTLNKVYLASHDSVTLESPQDMHMRIAIQLALHVTGRASKDRLAFCLQEYEDLSLHRKVYATPICRNSGYVKPQLSSCFLLEVPDNLKGIYRADGECATIHASMGGCAINMSNVRAAGAPVRSTGGHAAGLPAFAKKFDQTSSIVESGGRRSGANALWYEPYHLNVLELLQARTLTGSENMKMRSLFQGIMIPDLFFERVQSGGQFTLFDPSQFPGLSAAHNQTFRQMYENYERIALKDIEEKGVNYTEPSSGIELKLVPGRCAVLPAMSLWNRIKSSVSDSSIPYLVAKDAVNRRNQQDNFGSVTMSNLCTEIFQHTSPDLTAVCTLGNLVLPAFTKITPNGSEVDYELLHATAKRMCIGLNSVIDGQVLPTDNATRSSLLFRAIGMGEQGLANLLLRLEEDYDGDVGRRVNRQVSETIYHAALEASCELAEDTQPYPCFKSNGGSYLANGKFHWEVDGTYPYTLIHDWETLRDRIKKFGVANSLVTAYAPTSTTSLIEGNEETFQAITSNIVTKNTLSGTYTCVQPALCHELDKLGLWSAETRDKILLNRGSVSSLDIPDKLKKRFRTVYEIGMRIVIDMARDREWFIDQGQSLNLYAKHDVNFSSFLDTVIFYAWKKGCKNLMYYCRQEKATEALYVNIRDSELVQAPSCTCSELETVAITCSELETVAIAYKEEVNDEVGPFCLPGCVDCH